VTFGKPDKRIVSNFTGYKAREKSMRDTVGVHGAPGGSEARKGIGILKENPKHIQAQKDGKVPFEFLVLSVLEDDAYVHQHGAGKYGKNNWTIDEIRASTYIGAMFRHYKAWAEGEDLDPDSGKPHLTHLRACCAVVMDADKHGKLIDDRQFAETKADEPTLAEPSDEQWIVLETLDPQMTCRTYGFFKSKEAAKSYALIVHRASAQKNYCTVLQVNRVDIAHGDANR